MSLSFIFPHPPDDEKKKKSHRKEKLALRKEVNGEEHFEIYGGVKIRDKDEHVFARPSGLLR